MRWESIDTRAGAGRVADGTVRVLDVRTPEEFTQLGHIPGAVLCPVDWIPAAIARLDREGPPLLVVCEHGIRSAHACQWLSRAGFEVLNLAGGMAQWTGPRAHDVASPFDPAGPASWLIACGDLLPREGRALDLACGRGQNALLLAAIGLEVDALDRDLPTLETLASTATRLDLSVNTRPIDLETEPPPDLGESHYDLVVVFRFLHRPLFPSLLRALAPGGLLVYETFTRPQAERGHPRNPAFLLEAGELASRVSSLELLRQREGDFEGQAIASIAARRPVVS